MTFGEKLRKHRKEKNLTQQQVAEAIGVAPTTIVNYENGTTYPRDRAVYVKLAEILGVEADYLHNENDMFLEASSEMYGRRGKKQAAQLVETARGLFAGGELTDDEKLGVLNAMQEAFFECKKMNAEKYNPKKNKK